MGRLLFALAAFFAMLSVTTGAVAHATEPMACIDTSTAVSIGHSSGDSDQVPADADKGYPHHHGGCHGHQIGDVVADLAEVDAPETAITIQVLAADFVPRSPVHIALRPPIA